MINYLIARNCLHCGITFKPNNSSFGLYCSNKCQHDYAFELKYLAWLSGDTSVFKTDKVVKKAVIRLKGYSCQECKITEWNNKPIVLELEHIGGDSRNNKPEVLCLLCPNCHSQTTTFKNKNKGNGRKDRYKKLP